MRSGDALTLALSDAEVHIWQANLALSPSDCQQFAQTLSADEQARAGRLRFQRDRDRFIVSRGTLRALLGRYLEVSPERIRFNYSDKGKPALAHEFAGSGLEFNLSHSEDLMVCAIARQQPIGIDLEYLRPVADLANLTQRFFSPQEHAAIHTFAGDRCLQSFFQHWTCKEAVLKAAGGGLMSLSAIEVCLLNETAKLVRWGNDAQAAHTWLLQLFRPAPNYVAAVAINAPERTIVFRQW